MSKSRLSNLAILSIERQLAKKIKFDTVKKDFAALQARKDIDVAYSDTNAMWKTKNEKSREMRKLDARVEDEWKYEMYSEQLSDRYYNQGKRIAPGRFLNVFPCKRFLQSYANPNGLSPVWFLNILPCESYVAIMSNGFESNLAIILVMLTSSSLESNPQPANHQRLNINVTTCKIIKRYLRKVQILLK